MLAAMVAPATYLMNAGRVGMTYLFMCTFATKCVHKKDGVRVRLIRRSTEAEAVSLCTEAEAVSLCTEAEAVSLCTAVPVAELQQAPPHPNLHTASYRLTAQTTAHAVLLLILAIRHTTGSGCRSRETAEPWPRSGFQPPKQPPTPRQRHRPTPPAAGLPQTRTGQRQALLASLPLLLLLLLLLLGTWAYSWVCRRRRGAARAPGEMLGRGWGMAVARRWSGSWRSWGWM